MNIEIQTIIHNCESSDANLSGKTFTVDIFTKADKQVHAERFQITPTIEPIAIFVEKQIQGSGRDESSSLGLIKVQSKCSITGANQIKYQNSLNGESYVPQILENELLEER